MNWKLEVAMVPVSDVDRAKQFYGDAVGFTVDHDVTPTDDVRVVQLTPPGSACSIVISSGLGGMQPGTLQGLQLVVPDIEAARTHLADNGIDVSHVRHMGPADQNGTKFVFFSDPDGNGWAVQELRDAD
jgi:catechol 2,3-dioxygenase-like lactoylglutathione lyase family enzyme